MLAGGRRLLRRHQGDSRAGRTRESGFGVELVLAGLGEPGRRRSPPFARRRRPRGRGGGRERRERSRRSARGNRSGGGNFLAHPRQYRQSWKSVMVLFIHCINLIELQF